MTEQYLCRRAMCRLSVFLACAAMLLAGSVRASDTFTSHRVMQLRRVTSVHLSPDGGRIAYTLSVPRDPFEEDDGASWVELHVVDRAGKSRPFVTGQVNVSGVRWTPDGRSISFIAKRSGDDEKSLYTIPADGGEARKILEHDTGISSYSWSPDGSQVAFIATDDEPEEVSELEDKGFEVTVHEEDHMPVRVWIAKIDEEESEPRSLDLSGSPTSLAWSPVGDRLAVVLAASAYVDDRLMKSKLHVIDVASARVITRIDTPGKLGRFAWSPNGSQLAIIAAQDIHDPSAGRLMIANAEDGALADVLPDYMGQVSRVAWQDNETVMYVGDEGVSSVLAEIGADGANAKTHVPVGQIVLGGLSLSKDGQTAALIGDSPVHPREVYLSSHAHAKPRRLTNSNPSLADIRLAVQEVVTYNARDGLELQGILIRPLDEEKGKRYPLIVSVHGGPEGHRANGWRTRYSELGQLAAARGFAVFYPNYRGSTARGVAFSKLGQSDYAGPEFDDIVDGVDHLIATGLVDKDRVGVIGGSYGGYAAAWCATFYTERFAAAVMFAGISDLISKAGTTDIPNEMYLVHARRKPTESWDFFLERSPIKYVEQARTPILIAHGTKDRRVDSGQALELHRHLKELGKAPVRLVFYRGEGHGNRKAAARLDYNMRSLRWFTHYLQGPGGDPPPYRLSYDDRNE